MGEVQGHAFGGDSAMGAMNNQNLRVGVLAGGISSEREISLLSAQQVYESLCRKNIEAVLIDIDTSAKDRVAALVTAGRIDLAFIALHGEFGEDGSIQKIMEELNIPYTGSGPESSFLAMDKIASKRIFAEQDIRSPEFTVVEKDRPVCDRSDFPLVVKPYFGGSSLGISIAGDRSQLDQALTQAFVYGDIVLVEKYIPGREFTVGILEHQPLGVVEIVPRQGWYDFTAKYSDGMVDFIAPAQVDAGLYRRLQEYALASHRALGCRHFSRVDILTDIDQNAYVLEVNSIPGLTSHSLLPLSARCCGIGFDELIMRMVALSVPDKKEKVAP